MRERGRTSVGFMGEAEDGVQPKLGRRLRVNFLSGVQCGRGPTTTIAIAAIYRERVLMEFMVTFGLGSPMS